jgi:hypothetical protein
LPTFVAHVELRFDAEDLRDGGRRLRELAKAAEAVGFTMKRGRVADAPADDGDADGWTNYGPPTTTWTSLRGSFPDAGAGDSLINCRGIDFPVDPSLPLHRIFNGVWRGVRQRLRQCIGGCPNEARDLTRGRNGRATTIDHFASEEESKAVTSVCTEVVHSDQLVSRDV